MAEVSAALVKELREKTGSGIMDCKKALAENNGDIEKAVEFLRKKGLADAAKKASRAASEGLIGSYIHGGGKIGVLVEINCETDFVSMNPDFQAFVKDMCMHIAAANPQYIRREDIPQSVLDKEREIYLEQARATGKPEAVMARIVEGKVNTFCGDICLLDQKFVKDPDQTIQQVVTGLIARIRENISIRRFARYQLGEGLERKSSNFAEEVAAQAAMSQT